MEKEKLSELPLGEELKKLPVYKIVRLIIDMHSQKYEITGIAAMQVNTFFSEVSLVLAENILEREARAKEARAYKKHKFDY